MTLLEMIKFLRESLLDDTGGHAVSWEDVSEDDTTSHQLRWTNEELTTFINEGIRQACRRALLIKDVQSDLNISVLADTNTYALDQRIIRVKEVRSTETGKRLSQIELEDIWDMDSWEDSTGTPEFYVLDYNTNTITLYKKPINTDTLQLLVYREPMTELTWDNTDATTEITSRYHLPVLYFAAYMAYNKDEANTLDPDRSAYYMALFEQEFGGTTSAYAEKRRRRSRRRPIKYGGL